MAMQLIESMVCEMWNVDDHDDAKLLFMENGTSVEWGLSISQ